MSINNPGDNKNDKSNDQPRRPHGQRPSFFEMFNNPMGGMNPHPQRLNEVREALAERILASQSDEFSISLVPCTDDRLLLPALIVCVQKKGEEAKGAGIHTLIIESGELKLPPMSSMNYGGEVIDLPRPVTDVYDRVYMSVIMDQAKKHFEAQPNLPIFESSARIVSKDSSMTDKQLVHELTFDVLTAANRALNPAILATPEICLAQVQSGTRFVLGIEYGVMKNTTVQGHPIRNDVILTLKLELPSTPQRQMTADFGVVRGFFDVIPVPDKKFLARFVITDLSLSPEMIPSTSAQMLLLTIASALAEGDRWYGTFINSVMASDMGRRLEVLNPKLANTSLTREQQIQCLQEVFKPGLIFSLDCDSCGDNSWKNDIWAAAAHGNPEANHQLFGIAQELTAGKVESYTHSSSQLALSEENLIPMGDFINKDGTTRDIREVDQLLIMSHVTNDNGTASNTWRDTYLRMEIPLPMRVIQRRRIINGFLGSDADYRDHGTRATISAEFLRALQQGCRDAGLMVRMPSSTVVKTPDYPFEQVTVLGGDKSSGLFQEPYRGYLGYPGQQGNRRWS